MAGAIVDAGCRRARDVGAIQRDIAEADSPFPGSRTTIAAGPAQTMLRGATSVALRKWVVAAATHRREDTEDGYGSQ